MNSYIRTKWQILAVILFSSLLVFSLVYLLEKRISPSRSRMLPAAMMAEVHQVFDLPKNAADSFDIQAVSLSGEKLLGFIKDNDVLNLVLFEQGVGFRKLTKEVVNGLGSVSANSELSRIAFFTKSSSKSQKLAIWEEGLGVDYPLEAKFSGNWRAKFTGSGNLLILSRLDSEAQVHGPEFGDVNKAFAYSLQLDSRLNRFVSGPLKAPKLEIKVVPLFMKPEERPVSEEILANFSWHAEFRKKAALDSSRHVAADVDGDRVSDLLLFGVGDQLPFWQAFSLAGLKGAVRSPANIKGRRATWRLGNNSGVPITGDFDGDGFLDVGTFLPFFTVEREGDPANWELFLSNGKRLMEQPREPLSVKRFPWGNGDAKAVVGDFDADGKTDLGLYQKSTGAWFLLYSAGEYNMFKASHEHDGHSFSTIFAPGGVPVVGDYNGDGFTDLAVFTTGLDPFQELQVEGGQGRWSIAFTGMKADKKLSFVFGEPGDIPMPADFNCNGKTDLALYRPSEGKWLFRFGKNDIREINWQPNIEGERIPIVADYDGDGCSDPGFFIKSDSSVGQWIVLPSSFSQKVKKDAVPQGHNFIVSHFFGRREDFPPQVLLRWHQGYPRAIKRVKSK